MRSFSKDFFSIRSCQHLITNITYSNSYKMQDMIRMWLFLVFINLIKILIFYWISTVSIQPSKDFPWLINLQDLICHSGQPLWQLLVFLFLRENYKAKKSGRLKKILILTLKEPTKHLRNLMEPTILEEKDIFLRILYLLFLYKSWLIIVLSIPNIKGKIFLSILYKMREDHQISFN